MAFKPMPDTTRKQPAATGGDFAVTPNQPVPTGQYRGSYGWQHTTPATGWRATGQENTWQNTGKGRGGDAFQAQVARNKAAAAGVQPPAPFGSQSGPGILESWFNQRASGTDPGYEYAMNRGMNDIDSRMSAGGSYNSGARGQQLEDFAANMGAQREAQLDALAGGASGEHQGRLAAMFGQGQALASGQAGAGTAYDLGAAGNMAAASQAQQQMALNSAGQQMQQSQGGYRNLMQLYGLSQAGGGGGGSYYNANNPYPV